MRPRPRRAWCASQLRRIEAGLDPVRPRRAHERRPRAGNRRVPGASVQRAPAAQPRHAKTCLPDPKQMALAWHHERYEALEAGNPDTSDAVQRSLLTHVIPLLAAVVGTEVAVGRALVVDWVRCQSGRQPTEPDLPFAPGEQYEQSTVRGWLRLVREVLEHYRLLGYDVPDYGKGIRALELAAGHRLRRCSSLVDSFSGSQSQQHDR